MILLRDDHLRFFQQQARSSYIEILARYIEENDLARLGLAVRPTVHEWVQRALSGAESFGFTFERSTAQLVLLLLILEDQVGALPRWAYDGLVDPRHDEYQKLRWLVEECEARRHEKLDPVLIYPEMIGRRS
jgi:hypothetical protein